MQTLRETPPFTRRLQKTPEKQSKGTANKAEVVRINLATETPTAKQFVLKDNKRGLFYINGTEILGNSIYSCSSSHLGSKMDRVLSELLGKKKRKTKNPSLPPPAPVQASNPFENAHKPPQYPPLCDTLPRGPNTGATRQRYRMLCRSEPHPVDSINPFLVLG